MLTALSPAHHHRSPSSPVSSHNSPPSLLSPSVSSIFSDISVLSLPSAPSPCISPGISSTSIPTTPPTKTSAFFGSPFSTRPPSPAPPPTHHHHKSSSLDSVPIHQDPASLTIPPRLPPLSRLFPSRYLTDLPIDTPSDLHHHKRDFLVFNTEHLDTPLISSPISYDADSTPRPPSLVPSLSSSPSSSSTSASLPPPPSTDSAYVNYPEHTDSLVPGSIVSSHASGSDVSPGPPHTITLTLVRTLGQGAFSSVWLAEDASAQPLSAPARVGAHPRGAHIAGTSPVVEALRPRGLGLGISRSANAGTETGSETDEGTPRLVAVKITPRVRESDRTRVGFVREVEVLRHIAHPNITALLGAFSTPTHHVLVLPHLVGGDLLTLVNNDSAWSALTESTLQRMWCELCSAVAWMHSVGLVHRDIKLENILLAAPLDPLPPSSHALTQLGDFGLARFVDPRAPRLRTRCGSEAYAAPELVTAGRGYEQYDARATDAWACGVVLFAVCVRRLPFGEGVGADSGGEGVGGIRGEHGGAARQGYAYREAQWRGTDGGEVEGKGGRAERRRWLMRIARGEYEWPSVSDANPASFTEMMTLTNGDDELRGLRLVESVGGRRIVGRLLVRDPARRAAVGELWDDEWMQGWDRVEGRLVDWERVDRVVCQEVV